jgi:DNA-binding beta-propeller fold protein YncE
MVLAAVVLLSSFSLGIGSCNLTSNTAPWHTTPEAFGLCIAHSPLSTQVLTVNESSGTLDVITNNILANQIHIGDDPSDVVYSNNGTTALVTTSALKSSTGTLVVVNMANDHVVTRIPVGADPSGVVESPNGDLAYVADSGYVGPGNVDVVDLLHDDVVASIPVGEIPIGLALNALGTTLYVADSHLFPAGLLGTIKVIDTDTNTIRASVPIGSDPLFLALSPNGQTLAVGNYHAGHVSLVNTSTLAVRNLSVKDGPFGLAFSPDGAHLYVTDGVTSLVNAKKHPGNGGHFVIITIANDSTIASFNITTNPVGLTVDDKGTVFIAKGTFVSVAVYHPQTNTVSLIGTASLGIPANQKGR